MSFSGTEMKEEKPKYYIYSEEDHSIHEYEKFTDLEHVLKELIESQVRFQLFKCQGLRIMSWKPKVFTEETE